MPAAPNRVSEKNPAAAEHPLPAAKRMSFGVFEVDLHTQELRKNGFRIQLHGQPLQVLAALLERPGEIVTREELRRQLWPSDTFVDFEHSLNAAVKRLREALGDSADNSRFIETLPRQGYRFIAPVAEQGQTLQRPQNSNRTLWIAGLAGVMMAGLVLGLNLGGWRQRLLGRAHTVPIQSLAVLPLENLSGKPEEEYFADGMTEELITELGKIGNLRVISRQSVMHYKGTDKPLPQIASELQVEALVQGSALRAGNRVRITMQLVRAAPEEHLWAESYERNLTDIIDLQRDVVREIASQVRVTLSPDEQAHLAQVRPVGPEVYNAYLQGRYFSQRPSRNNREKAISYYEHAIELDPNYAPAWAGLAGERAEQADSGPVAMYLKAREAAERALALDANLVDAHVALGGIKLMNELDWDAADASFRRALTLGPGNPAAIRGVAEMAFTRAHFDEALALDRRATELDPLSPGAFVVYGFHAYCAGRLKEAVAAEKKALELDSSSPYPHPVLGMIYIAQGRPEAALAEMKEEKVSVSRNFVFALSYHALGRKRESDSALAALTSEAQNVMAFQIAEVHAFRGEADQAFRWLERAHSQRDGGLIFIKSDPLLKSLEHDSRYVAFLKKMRLPV